MHAVAAMAAAGNPVAAETRRMTHRFSREQLAEYGVALGSVLAAPALVTLAGDLGAGKTTLVQAICRGLRVTEPVTSPTYALVHEYAAPKARVVHCDLYRLETPREVTLLGLDDILGDPTAIVLVEWPERAGDLLPTPTLAVSLSHVAGDGDVRELTEVGAS